MWRFHASRQAQLQINRRSSIEITVNFLRLRGRHERDRYDLQELCLETQVHIPIRTFDHRRIALPQPKARVKLDMTSPIDFRERIQYDRR